MNDTRHEVAQLDNGATTCFTHVPGSRSLHLSFTFQGAGHLHTPPELPETAHMMEHMVYEGSEHHPDRQEFYDVIERNGSYLNAFTYADYIDYVLTTPLHNFEPAVEALCGAIEAPLFKETALTTEREVVREELLGNLNEDYRLLAPLIWRAAGRRFAPDLHERLQTLDDTTPDDLREHHERTHTSSNLLINVTGGFSQEQMHSLTQRFGRLSINAGSPPAVPEFTDIETSGPVILEKPGKSNITYDIGKFAMSAITLQQDIAGDLLKDHLLHYPGSAILRPAREQGLAYTMSSDLFLEAGKGNFELDGSVSLDNVLRLWRLMGRSLTQAFDLLDTATFNHIKEYRLGQTILDYEDVEYIHNAANYQLKFFGHALTPEEVLATIELMTLEDYRRQATTILAGGMAIAAVVVPPEVKIAGLRDELVQLQTTLNVFR